MNTHLELWWSKGRFKKSPALFALSNFFSCSWFIFKKGLAILIATSTEKHSPSPSSLWWQMRNNKMKSQDLAASSLFLLIPGSDSGTSSEKEAYPFLHLKSNDLFFSFHHSFFLSKKAKLGYIEMGPVLPTGIGQSHSPWFIWNKVLKYYCLCCSSKIL